MHTVRAAKDDNRYIDDHTVSAIAQEKEEVSQTAKIVKREGIFIKFPKEIIWVGISLDLRYLYDVMIKVPNT